MIRTLGLVCLAAGVLATPGRAEEWNKTWSVAQKPELRLDTNDASVQITGADISTIEAHVFTTGWRIGSGEVQITEHQNGSRVELTVHIPQHHFQLNFGNRSVRVEIRAPRSVAADIHTGDGRIVSTGLHASQKLSSGDGSIEVTDAMGGLDARSGDGKIRARGKFNALSLDTGDGSIEATVEQGSQMDAPWRVHTGDGHVTLRLPANFSADVDAHTGDGHISSDLQLVTNSSSGERHDVRGKLNGGGRSLVIRSGDGSIQLERL